MTLTVSAVPNLGSLPGHSAVDSKMQALNDRSKRPLTHFERQTLDAGRENPFYIYNVSPIHEWPRPMGQMGTITIPKRDWKASISSPTIIPGATLRWVNKGLMIDAMIEGGQEITEDILGCGISMDGRHPSGNLTRYGCFYTSKPFEASELSATKRAKFADAPKNMLDQLKLEYLIPKHEQKSLIDEATVKLLNELQARILEADNWHNAGPNERKYIGQWHRENLRAFNEITGRKESRPWASITMGDTLSACDYCGNMNKPGLVKCPNCLEVLDPVAYKKLQDALKA